MDYYDRSQQLEQIQREEALARQRVRFSGVYGIPGIETALDCLDCGNEIPAARRSAVPGTFYCVECQQRIEQQRK